MNFTTYASGSSGNLYRLDDGTSTIMIEAGLRFPDIRQHFKFQLASIAGCLVSHEHQDHAMSAAKLMQAGVDIYMTEGTATSLKLSGHRLKTIKSREQFKVGSFTVLPFKTAHDVAESVGFLIASGREKLLFATDTLYIPYQFRGLTIIAIECNYDISLLDKNVAAVTYPRANRNRVRKSHMSLETCLSFLKATDLSKVREIHLLHLSDNNSDAAEFKNKIQGATGKPVVV